MSVRPRARLAKIAGRTHTSHWRSPLISFVIRRFRNTLSSPASTLGATLLNQYFEVLARILAEILHGYLSSVQLLFRRVIETGRSLASVRVVETSSEFFWFINLRWSAVDFDAPLRWILQGDGPICSERWHRRGLQVLQESRLVEVVDEQELAATPRGTGLVLVTDFYNGVWLLLRYDTGALAEGLRDGTRPCGMRLRGFARTYLEGRGYPRYVQEQAQHHRQHSARVWTHSRQGLCVPVV